MPRKRKIPVHVPEDENDENTEPEDIRNVSKPQHGPMYTIMANAQLNETFHNKYIKEMQQLYLNMDHDAFMFTYIKMIKSAMAAEESNEYANTTLMFCSKFVASYDDEDTHPVLTSTFKWLLSTISNSPHIRFRLCQFVNMVLNALGIEAALDDTICDSILSYMINRLRDLNPNVRVQAILALQRLQIPDNPDDMVVKTYQFHLSSDPSSRVRQAVITSMGRNYNTIPYILERLWDVDEKVRRHAYLHMSSYPVKAYKVSQRLTFLEQGLNDRSDMVRKVVTTVMLPQWLESYNRNVISLISALRLDANESEIDRFRKITKLALFEIFKRQKKEDLVKALPIDEEGEYEKCVPFDKLSIEVALYWLCLTEYLQMENADELDCIIPELTTFCNYVQKYCESSRAEMEKWQKTVYQYTLLILVETVNTFDLGDEIGRDNLRILLGNLLTNFDIEEHIIKVVIQCTENLITKLEDRLQFFVDIIKELTDAKSLTNELSHDRNLIDELLEKHPDKKDLKFQISALKVKLLELEEQETDFVRKKDYAQAQRIAEELNACREEYMNVLKPILDRISTSESGDSGKFLSLTFQQKKLSPEVLIKSLQISYYMVASKNVKSLTPNVCDLYKDFIRRHVESNQIAVRDWALRCGTAYSMLYEPLSKDVYNELYSQFYKNHNIRLWKIAIECIFELLDRYGCSHFEVEEKHNKSRKTGRQLYNTMESIDAEEDTSTNGAYGVDLIFMMSHFLDTCDDTCIISALVVGFGRLVLHGHIKNDDIIEKLLLKYFNPATDSEVNQLLGVFFENLIKKKKQEYLQPCLLPTISTIMSAPYDSPLHEIKSEHVLRFVIDSTRPIYCKPSLNIHNTLALSFMQEMQNNISNRELLKILSKEIVTLEVLTVDDTEIRGDMRTNLEKLLQCDIDPKTAKYLVNFREILDGTFNPNALTVRTTVGKSGGSDEELEDGSDDEDENRNLLDDNNEKNKQKGGNELEALVEEPEEEEAQAEKTVEEPPDITAENLQESAIEPQASTETEEQAAEDNAEETTNDTAAEITIPPEQQTPTTFGKDNTTNLRYLRKSMNIHQRSMEELSPKKPKLRTNEKTKNTRTRRNIQKSAAKQQQEETNNENNHLTNEENSIADADRSMHDKTMDSVASKDAPMPIAEQSSTVSESSEDFQPLRVSDDEVFASETEEEEVPSSQNVASDGDEAEVAPSPTTIEVTKAIRKRNEPQVSKVANNSKSNTLEKTKNDSSKDNTSKITQKSNDIEPKGGRKRRQRLFMSPKSKTGDDNLDLYNSPLRKQRRKTLEISDISKPKSENAKKGQSKSSSSVMSTTKITNANKRNSTGEINRTIIEPAAKPVSLVVSAGSAHQTRNASKQTFRLNNIMTRKKTLQTTPLRKRTSTPSSDRHNSKENSIQGSNKKSASKPGRPKAVKDTTPSTTSRVRKSQVAKNTTSSATKSKESAGKETSNTKETPQLTQERKSREKTRPKIVGGNADRSSTPQNHSSPQKQSQSVPKPKSTRITNMKAVAYSAQKPSIIGTRSRMNKK